MVSSALANITVSIDSIGSTVDVPDADVDRLRNGKFVAWRAQVIGEFARVCRSANAYAKRHYSSNVCAFG